MEQNSGMGEEERERGKKEKKKGEKKKFIERSFTFSRNFLEIGPSVSRRARDKVLPHGESFKLRLETGSFDKLQEVGVFSYSV